MKCFGEGARACGGKKQAAAGAAAAAEDARRASTAARAAPISLCLSLSVSLSLSLSLSCARAHARAPSWMDAFHIAETMGVENANAGCRYALRKAPRKAMPPAHSDALLGHSQSRLLPPMQILVP